MTEHPNLAAALVAALADLTTVDTDRTADAGSYKYKYADLGDIVKDTRPVLAQHGVVALTPLGAHGNELAVTVILLHSSGESMEFGPFPFPHGRDAQATGSMVTYHRRYALLAALGMATGDDDAGAAAAPRQKEPERVPLPHGLTQRLDSLPAEAQERLKTWAEKAGEHDIRNVPAAWVEAVERAIAAEERKTPNDLAGRAAKLGEKVALPPDAKKASAGDRVDA